MKNKNKLSPREDWELGLMFALVVVFLFIGIIYSI